MSAAVEILAGQGLHHLPIEFPLAAGGSLPSGLLAFELEGNPAGPVVAIQGGISSGRHVASSSLDPSPGWWEAIVGPERAIDTRHVRVLATDWLGGTGASSGPANWGRDEVFPLLSSRDQARAIARLLDHLGIEKLERFIGASYGGMVALAFAEEFPERLGGAVAISAAHEAHPRAVAWRSLERRAVELGLAAGRPEEGLALARGLAFTTYRSRGEFAARFGAPAVVERNQARFAVENYLESRGREFANRFDARSFCALTLAIDLHRVTPERIEVPTTLLAATSDELVPIEQMRELAARLAGAVKLIEFPSEFGHDAFLKEIDLVSGCLAAELSGVSPIEVSR